MVDVHFCFHHFQDTVLQWLSSVLVFHENKVILSTLHIQDFYAESTIFFELGQSARSEIRDLLLGNQGCIISIQTAKINVLINIVHLVDLIEDLPSHLTLDSVTCPHELLVKHIFIAMTHVSNQVGFAYLHPLVKDLVVLVTDVLISLLFFENSIELGILGVVISDISGVVVVQEGIVLLLLLVVIYAAKSLCFIGILLHVHWVRVELDYLRCP